MRLTSIAFTSLVVPVLASAGACTTSPPPQVTGTGALTDPRVANIIDYLQQELEDHDIPGASIAIVANGELLAAAGVGTKQRGGTDPVVPTTLFRIATLSQLVTATTALGLVDTGTMSLDAPITTYVPYAAAAGYDSTSVHLDQLLDHTSGVPHLDEDTQCGLGADARTAWLAADHQPLWTTPGQLWNFSGRGFDLAGWAIQGASGSAYEDVVSARVFSPAQMYTATFDVEAATANPDHATGNSGSTTYEPNAYACSVTAPDIGVIASALDMAALAQTFVGGTALLSPASQAALETGNVDTHEAPFAAEQYGYGMYVRDPYKGLHVVRHEGSFAGYEATLWMVPEQQFAVVVLYNATGRNPSHVAARALDQILGVGDVAAPVDTTPATTWSAYVGTYNDTFGIGEIDVAQDASGALSLSVPSLALTGVPMTQVGGDEFSITLDGNTEDVTFVPDGSLGGSAAFIVSRKGVGVRVAAPTPPSSPSSK